MKSPSWHLGRGPLSGGRTWHIPSLFCSLPLGLLIYAKGNPRSSPLFRGWRKENEWVFSPDADTWTESYQVKAVNRARFLKRQNHRTRKDELSRSEGARYATGDQWRNNSRKNEGMEPKQKQYPVVDVIGDRSKVQCCKEQYCIGTWNVRSMNQGKLEVVKQEMARVNVNILGISELKWTEMSEFNSDDHYIYYCGQESLRRNGVAIMVNKRVWNAVLGCNLKNDRMISVLANHSISQ